MRSGGPALVFSGVTGYGVFQVVVKASGSSLRPPNPLHSKDSLVTVQEGTKDVLPHCGLVCSFSARPCGLSHSCMMASSFTDK